MQEISQRRPFRGPWRRWRGAGRRGTATAGAWLLLLLAQTALAPCLAAGDWPEWRGEGRRGVWEETGILDVFPVEGLTIQWRTPIAAGYAGPAVANGRVFVTDFRPTEATRGIERALCLDEQTGRVLWTREWKADYRGLQYASGPRATPTVDGGRVYVLGTTGILLCLDVRTGEVLWEKDFVRDFATEVPAWGLSSAPLVDGPRLIALAGGHPDAKVIAFDKRTGDVIWKALSSTDSEPGYSQPVLVESGKTRQLIIWHTAAVAALHPEDGRVLWQQPFKVHMNTPIATPVWRGPLLLVSAFFNGARLFRLGGAPPVAELLWKGASDSEIDTDGLHALMAAPILDGDYIYGICSYGQLRCLRIADGSRVWETQQVTVEKARNASAFLVRNGERFFINNDRGELILARLSPSGYDEISRTQLIEPTSEPGARRERGAVQWSHPAYANGHIFARNDKEILRASLQQP
jgi:outer membrane protein assembly factor BamB